MLLLLLLLVVVVAELLLVAHGDVRAVVEDNLLRRLHAVVRGRMLQVEELHEAEVLEHVQSVLEETQVELLVVIGPDLNELEDEERRVSVFVFAHAVLVAGE